MRAKLIVETRDHLIARWRSLLMVIWRLEPTTEAVAAARAGHEAVAAENPGRVLILTIVEASAEMPSAPVRRALGDLMTRTRSDITLSALVHEGTGFRAAAVRGIVTGLTLLTKVPYPHEVFASVPSAAAWLCAKSPVAESWGDRQLVDVVAEVRAR